MPRARKELRPQDLTYLIDTREQAPLDLSPFLTVTTTLPTGDYSVAGLEHVIAIERKSLQDLLGCIGQGRERFEKEIQRLLAYECRAIVVEASWADLERGEWRSQVTVQAALGSVLGWIARGVPVVMAGDRRRAAQTVARLCFIAARRRWRETVALCENLRIASTDDTTPTPEH